jgi:hypothetical protein
VHGCHLEDAISVGTAIALGEPPQQRPVGEPLATLDRYTYTALTVGRVELPGRSVHAGVWFRLLRSLLDEVSLAVSTVSVHARTTLERIWTATGRPLRGGLNAWQPYEVLKPEMQQAMLHAAAAALQLAADGQITARGVLGSALQTPRRQVFNGDPPTPSRPDYAAQTRTSWAEAMAEIEAALVRARTDGQTAKQLLVMLTIGCRTLDRFEEQRSFLFGAGVPAEFLPDARYLGRTDLI